MSVAENFLRALTGQKIKSTSWKDDKIFSGKGALDDYLLEIGGFACEEQEDGTRLVEPESCKKMVGAENKISVALLTALSSII